MNAPSMPNTVKTNSAIWIAIAVAIAIAVWGVFSGGVSKEDFAKLTTEVKAKADTAKVVALDTRLSETIKTYNTNFTDVYAKMNGKVDTAKVVALKADIDKSLSKKASEKSVSDLKRKMGEDIKKLDGRINNLPKATSTTVQAGLSADDNARITAAETAAMKATTGVDNLNKTVVDLSANYNAHIAKKKHGGK